MVHEMQNEQWTAQLHLLQKYQRMNEQYNAFAYCPETHKGLIPHWQLSKLSDFVLANTWPSQFSFYKMDSS
jgi:hypothetical protein